MKYRRNEKKKEINQCISVISERKWHQLSATSIHRHLRHHKKAPKNNIYINVAPSKRRNSAIRKISREIRIERSIFPKIEKIESVKMKNRRNYEALRRNLYRKCINRKSAPHLTVKEISLTLQNRLEEEEKWKIGVITLHTYGHQANTSIEKRHQSRRPINRNRNEEEKLEKSASK